MSKKDAPAEEPAPILFNRPKSRVDRSHPGDLGWEPRPELAQDGGFAFQDPDGAIHLFKAGRPPLVVQRIIVD